MPPEPRDGGESAHGSRAGITAIAPGLLLLALLAALWTWWGWEYGGYFGTVLYPGGIALCALLAVVVWMAPESIRVSRAAAVALAATLALAAWTMLSMLWSPAPDEALADATRVIVYALSFALGIWFCRLLAERVHLALLPLAVAGGLVAVATAIALLGGGEADRFIEADGSLMFPLGYRNANVAFFMIALWPALALAAAPTPPWWLRAAMLGSASLCAEIALLSQSRGAVLAVGAAVFVWLLVYPWRLRALAWLLLLLAPVAVALPSLLEPYQSFQDGEPIIPELEQAGRAMLLTGGGAVVLGAVAALLDPAPPGRRAPAPALLAPLGIGIVAVILGATGALLVAGEDPVDFADRRIAEIGSAENPDLSSAESRFAVNVQSKRTDIWRVAADQARDHPLLGTGAGGFEHVYLRERDVPQTARDAHSVEMELLSELGIPGLVIFAVLVVAAAAAALRSRRLGGRPAILAAGALTSGAYWLAHSSIDWFWTYPVLTAAVFALMGSAAAPALRRLSQGPSRQTAIGVAVASVAAAVVFTPLYLSERYTANAYNGWRSDLDRAYSDLDRAADLNPFSDAPLLAEGAIAQRAGDRERAIAAYRRASERRPDEWVGYYLVAQLLARDDRAAARKAMARAAELNPQSVQIRRALEDLRAPQAGAPTADG